MSEGNIIRKFGGIDVGRFTDRSVYVEYDVGSHVLTNCIELRPGTFRQQADAIRKHISYPTLVDCTGIGQGFYEVLLEYGLPVRRMVLVASDQFLWKPIDGNMKDIAVSKTRLVHGLASAMDGLQSRLTPEANASMAFQFRHFVARTGKRTTYEAKIGHDDYIIATGAAMVEAQIHGEQIRGKPRPREVIPSSGENHYKGRTLYGESYVSGGGEPRYGEVEKAKSRNWRGICRNNASGGSVAKEDRAGDVQS